MRGLRTDLYEIRMAASYQRRGMTDAATFSLFPRKLPRDRGFLVAAGLADCLTFLENFQFDAEDLGYLEDVVGLPGDDLDWLAGVRFTGDVRAVPEGEVVAAGEPILEVTAPLPQAQLVETAVLNFVTFQTTVATKAARCRIAAREAGLVDFAARRTHGLEAARAVARASGVVGFNGTSYVAAAREFGLTPIGTIAHSYVEAFRDERSAFESFAEDFPGTAVFLVDTYDTPSGVRTAIEVARRVRPSTVGVRLDSGDLRSLALESRRLLDEAGYPDARIMASGGLDEYAIDELTAAGSPIDLYGVGTHMGVSTDAPSLDSAYKLVAYDDRPVMKLSPGKITAPAAKQTYRGASGQPDVLALRDEPAPPGRTPLLRPVMRAGQRLERPESLSSIRARFTDALGWLPDSARRLRAPEPIEMIWSDALRDLTESLRHRLADTMGINAPAE